MGSYPYSARTNILAQSYVWKDGQTDRVETKFGWLTVREMQVSLYGKKNEKYVFTLKEVVVAQLVERSLPNPEVRG